MRFVMLKCNDYDPILCKKQCKIIDCSHRETFKGNCIDGGGSVVWEKINKVGNEGNITEKIKDLYEGDIVRIKGEIYKIKYIEKSPWKLEKSAEMVNLILESIEDPGEYNNSELYSLLPPEKKEEWKNVYEEAVNKLRNLEEVEEFGEALSKPWGSYITSCESSLGVICFLPQRVRFCGFWYSM